MSSDSDNHPTHSGGSHPHQSATPFDSAGHASEINVNQLHESVVREKSVQEEGREPLPLFWTLLFALLVFWAGAYLFRYSGGFDSNVFNEEQITYGMQKGGGAAAAIDPVAVGKRLYAVNCSSCHGGAGAGTPNQYPPLAGSEIVLGNGGYGENHLARIMLNGLVGPLTVGSNNVNGNMPAWGGNLKDDQIAYILTFIRQEWGNKADPISPEGIAAVRAEVAAHASPWTDGELKGIPAATLAAAKK